MLRTDTNRRTRFLSTIKFHIPVIASVGSLPILSLDCSHQSHNMLFLSQQENLCVQPETTENNNFHILGMPGTNHLYNQVGGPDSTR